MEARASARTSGVAWTSVGGTVHTGQDADQYLVLPKEWPALPAGPSARLGVHVSEHLRITQSALLDYRERYVEALGYVDGWISTLAADTHNRENRQYVGRDALAYYEQQYVETSMFSGEYFTEMWTYEYGETSLRILLFMELCRLRVILRTLFGPPWGSDGHPQDWPTLFQKHVTLRKQKTVGFMTLQELEQAFVVLFRRWHTMPYSPELEDYVNRLLDKQATFFCAGMTAEEMDVPLYRTPLRNGGAELQEQGGTRAQQGQTPQTHQTRTNPRNPLNPLSDKWYGPTLTFTFKCQLRYYNVMSRLNLVRDRRRVPFAELKVPEHLPAPYDAITPNALSRLVRYKATKVRSEMHEALQKMLLQDLLHPGDAEWLAFLRPIAQRTNQMLITAFHDEESARYHSESHVKAIDVLKIAHSNLRTGSRARAFVDLVDKMLPYHIRFIRDYVIQWPDLVTRFDHLVNTDKPLLVQFFGHFELYWCGTIYTLHAPPPRPQPIESTATGPGAPGPWQPGPHAVYELQDVAHTVHMWLRIMAWHPGNQFQSQWHDIIAPEMDSWLQTLLMLQFRNNKGQEEAANIKATTLLRTYHERRYIAAAELEALDRELWDMEDRARRAEASAGAVTSATSTDGDAMDVTDPPATGAAGGGYEQLPQAMSLDEEDEGEDGIEKEGEGSTADSRAHTSMPLHDPATHYARITVNREDVEHIQPPILAFYK